MPDGNWVGAGFHYSQNNFYSGKNSIVVKTYLGTDKAEFNLGFKRNLLNTHNHNLSVTSSLSVIPYDNIVNAYPIRANERNFIPYIIIGYAYKTDKYVIRISETASLPSIESDNNLYLKLGMSLEFPFNFR